MRDSTSRPSSLDWPTSGEEVSARVLAKMAYRAEPEGVLAVFEIPQRDAARATRRSSSSRSGSRSPATSVRWRAPRTRPAPTRCSSPTPNADPWNPNAIRASTGAVFTLPIVEATLDEVRALPLQKSPPSSAPRPLHRRRPDTGRPRFVVGAEDDGLDARWRDAADVQVAIPMNARDRRQPERGDQRRGPPLRGGAPAWLTRHRPTRDDVERARATIGDRLPRTPLLSSRTIGARLKCELFQRTGSFKPRGALNKISNLTRRREARAA